MKDGVKDLDGVVTRKGTDYVKLGYSALKVSENDYSGTGASAKPGEGKDWTAGTFTTKRVNATTSSAVASYWTQYVDSQQVSTNTEHQVGFVGGLPYITLPGNSAALNAATKATSVLPKPTSPHNNLSIGEGFSISSLICLIALD